MGQAAEATSKTGISANCNPVSKNDCLEEMERTEEAFHAGNA